MALWVGLIAVSVLALLLIVDSPVHAQKGFNVFPSSEATVPHFLALSKIL
jgi:hypothetical protein